ncbi:hypothetical protein FBUS_05710 [Fasciolopsis buskii]|uniref:Uncharacterized protein n=1 Tax=Fasciolopsis buskii TaxID=27845 RepID=A0A8E0RN42_9TREM|nr:hypothetical protein FBUS_05710 [Fasciolopsis buski]
MATTSGGGEIPDLDKGKSHVTAKVVEDDDNLWRRSKSDASFFLNTLSPQMNAKSSHLGNVSEHSKVYWDIPEAIEASEGNEDSSVCLKNRSPGGDIGRGDSYYRPDFRKSEKSHKSG